MKKLKVIIIIITILMVFNASASELQEFIIEPVTVSGQTNTMPVVEKQEQPPIILLDEGATNYCEEKTENA